MRLKIFEAMCTGNGCLATGPVGTTKTETVRNKVMAYVVMADIVTAHIVMGVSTSKTKTVRTLICRVCSFAGMSPDQRHQIVHETRTFYHRLHTYPRMHTAIVSLCLAIEWS